MNASTLVQKLWNYCNVLRDDGMSYGDYVEQLTYLLFLKMADERSRPPYHQLSPIPAAYAWPALLAKDGDSVAGLAVIAMQGVLSGYLQTLAVSPAHRGRGLGAALLARVEARVFRERPNVFPFVSSLNDGARRFYEAHGYTVIGEVPDFLVAGHGEVLMRKTIGPLYPASR